MFLEITFKHWLVILSALISLAGSISYIKDTLKGKTTPNLVSWSLWAIVPLIGVFAALSGGADLWSIIRIFLAGFIPLIIFSLAILKNKGYWKFSKFDIICGLCAILALAFWLIIDDPEKAVLLAALGDFFAALPTIKKAWKNPETETGTIYLTSLLSVLLVLPSIPKWDISNSAFQIYLILTNSILIFAIYRNKIFSPYLRHIKN